MTVRAQTRFSFFSLVVIAHADRRFIHCIQHRPSIATPTQRTNRQRRSASFRAIVKMATKPELPAFLENSRVAGTDERAVRGEQRRPALLHQIHAVLVPIDRKSTRLNSSHSQISYAV